MHSKHTHNKLVIVGGGSAGWMSAAMLRRLLPKSIDIELVESDQIGTIGVGEASIPPLTLFNQGLGIAHKDFMAATKASIKLGIQFEGWGREGDSYMHAFGRFGKDLGLVPFHQYWLAQGQAAETLWDYSLNYQAAKRNNYAELEQLPNAPWAGLVHAYHFDAGLYANFLSQQAQAAGVKRTQGHIDKVSQCPDSGDITGLTLTDGTQVSGDFYIDCSGLHALLIQKTLGVGFDDWSHWLPADRAWAVPSERQANTRPYTRSIAHDEGWQWQIPLQHRIGNGMVYSSRFISDEDAKAQLMANLPGKPLAEPRLIRFQTGRRRKAWQNNCVAIGLSAGFLEPLESTSIHLIQSGVLRLAKLFPSGDSYQALADEFNRQSEFEYSQVRDFIILHYHLNQRANGRLWAHCRQMTIPESLRLKMALFAEQGVVTRNSDELFAEEAWLQVMLGQGLQPERANALTGTVSDADRAEFLSNVRQIMAHASEQLPSHDQYLNQFGAV
ncbi:tryptophan halogenase family protein [Paraferrimonas sedimenticola]|uniref:Tryptophan halogenase n=1 Tax=Paraferrimonas sedimenticola TaxID=375674 RepID=A0AA37RU70_9GAMM|nr:tryptophan halogenase family protein [Paraferrimonas sedimenticola]GLP95855.1 tryptophan halogenase [Paraferrimonas sedimenticola]